MKQMAPSMEIEYLSFSEAIHSYKELNVIYKESKQEHFALVTHLSVN